MKRMFVHLLLSIIFILPSCGDSYYFDSVSGNDTNSGKTRDKAFKSLSMTSSLTLKPGDKILIKSGTEYHEQLYLKAEGTDSHPITISSYGEGSRPHIAGDGRYDAPLHIFNSRNIVISNLELSNKSESPVPGLMGLFIELKDYGVAENITVDSLLIHHVIGTTTTSDGGGMAICARNGRDDDTLSNRFENLIIKNCEIRDCQRDAIKILGYWIRSQWNPNKGVLISGNIIDGIPGDGIMVSGCDGAVIEYNVMKNCPATLPPTEACDGIWPWCSDNTLVQFNEVSDHKSIIDAYAYDSDWGCRNSVFQYNLSHDNSGGMMLVIGTDGWPEDWCVNGNIETIIRYNVSINDGLRDYPTDGSGSMEYFCPVIHFTGFTKDNSVEHNIFYSFPKSSPEIDRTYIRFTKHDSMYGQGDKITYNVFFSPETANAVIQENSVNNHFEGNLYIGPVSVPQNGFELMGDFHNAIERNVIINEEEWSILSNFLKNKFITVNGERKNVLHLLTE